MGLILRQSAQNTLFSYAGALVGFVNVIWLYPFILETGEFGLTRVMISIAMIGTHLASLGMGRVTLRFFPAFRSPEQGHYGYLFLAVTIPMAGFILLSAAGWLLRHPLIDFYSDETALFESYFLLIFPLLFFILYFYILESYIRSLYDTVVATFLQDILLRLLQSAVVLFYYFGWFSFGAFLWAFTATFAVQTLLLLLYIGYREQLYMRPDLRLLSRGRIRRMADFALFAILGNVTALALGNIDMLMVGGIAGLSETAIYAVGFYLASMIKIPSRALWKISQPLIAQAHHENDMSLIYELYAKSSINQILVGGVIFAGIWINLEHLMRFLPPVYHGATWVFVFVGLAKMLDLSSGVAVAIVRTSRWYRFDLYVTILLLALTIITNLLLIPRYGITGAAVATAFSVGVYHAAVLIYIGYRFNMHPFSRKTPLALLVLLIALGVACIVPLVPFWPADLLLRSAVLLIVTITGIFLLQLSPEMQKALLRSFELFKSALGK